MNVNTLRAILQSDFKLWENAETEVDGTAVIKTIDLPYNIGPFTLRFEGVDSGSKTRAAAEMWGASVRAEVDSQIGEESVTSRAAQKAALALPPTDIYHGGDGDGEAKSGQVPDEETVPTYGQDALTTGDDIVDRLVRIRARIAGNKKALDRDSRELRALEAFKEVLDGDQTEVPTDSLDATS